MDLALPDAPTRYRSSSQITRIITEEWGKRNLYCPACDCDELRPTPNNTRAVDFICPGCEQSFQLKSSNKHIENRIADAGYKAMITAIRSDSTPNLFVLHYSNSLVKNVLLVPHFFFVETAIEQRKPLGPLARRAGWIGCNIMLNRIAEEGKIHIINNNVIVNPVVVRANFKRISPIAKLNVSVRGWTLDVLTVLNRLYKSEFSLSEVYTFESELAALHPDNKHIRDKIRQQLQILRDLGFLEFKTRGIYRLLGK